MTRSLSAAIWTSISVAALLAVVPRDLPAQTGRGTAVLQPVPQAVLDLQRAHDYARLRGEPVTHLLANVFVDIRADGRVLPLAIAIKTYTREDQVPASALGERRMMSYGDVVIISGRTGEEGTGYSARRLYVWINERGSWRLLVFQKTFMRSRTARLSLTSDAWPAEYSNGPTYLAEEQTFATRDRTLLRGLLADDAVLIDGHGEQLTAPAWLAQVNEAEDAPVNVRQLVILHQGKATVVIGDEVSAATGLPARFTRVWTRSPQGLRLRVSQTTLAAAEVFGP